MKKSPWFAFFPADWLCDGAVMAMSMAERGLYLHLLCIEWREGGLPTNVNELKRLCPGVSDNEFAAFWSRASCKFKVRDNVLVSPRLEQERETQERLRSERSVAGKKGADKRWQGHSKATRLPLAKGMAKNGPSPSPVNSPPPPPGGDDQGPPAAPPRKPARKKRARADLDAELAGTPEWLAKAAREWVAYREERGLAYYTPRGFKALLSELADLGEKRALEAMRFSMGRNYQGIIEPGRNGSPPPKTTPGRAIQETDHARQHAERLAWDEWEKLHPGTIPSKDAIETLIQKYLNNGRTK